MIRPVDFTPSQDYGDNPTKWLPYDNWLIQMFGNYQPDGHTGRDYPCPAGTPVRAVTGGVVLHVGWYAGTYADNPYWISPSFAGFVYVVDHGWFIGIYAHCTDGGQKVSVGQRVSEGQILGLSGNTGASTGAHLHFEVLPDGFVVNSYMFGRIDPDVIFGSDTNTSGELSPAGTSTTILEDEMSAADVQAIRGDIATVHNTIIRDVGSQLGGIKADIGTVHNTIIKDVGSQLGGLREALKQVAAGQGVNLDMDAIQEAARKGAEDALRSGVVTVDVNVAGGSK
ncbi:M23 family metallopeptidase [Pseudarthrobacter sp. PS3-L1]|uniref:M23 family metallopeptidase n=1 Tax=Pseudarthrobacter sp. PS3-L1 TaxID=3046207 RepID=UPI0024BA3083|nr:M23 family metallopeptidase [Pseudarthrobacter sp. PS3-L1]MDJ0321645.1 M23 family metallopeptidase [Pseudarthrobacter sp. PS3-L1]